MIHNPKEDWASIPPEFLAALSRYFFQCLKPGSATLSALHNNYTDTMIRFHPLRWQGAYALAHLLVYLAPPHTWGSERNVEDFLRANTPINPNLHRSLVGALGVHENAE